MSLLAFEFLLSDVAFGYLCVLAGTMSQPHILIKVTKLGYYQMILAFDVNLRYRAYIH